MRRIALLSAIVLAIAIVSAVSLGARSGGSAAGPQPDQVTAVTSVIRACPPAAPGSGQARIALISRPAKSAAAEPAGSATFAALPAAPAAAATPAAPAAKTGVPVRPVTVSAVGNAATVTAPGTGGTVATVAGQMAGGFEAEESDASGTGLVSCTHPGSDMWFVGTGQSDGAPVIRLYLMNNGTLAASATVTLLTDSGQQDGLSGTVTVPPGRTVTENVAAAVPGSLTLGLHVQATSGQVAAAVWEGTAAHGKTAAKGTWLPEAAAPAASLVIPGLTVARSAAKLYVTVPGSTDARLKVVAYTASGAVTQFAGTAVGASAGATTQLFLSSLGSSVAGLVVTSSVPVVASVLVPGAGIGSFTTAVSPVTEQGEVAGNPATRGVTVGLLLTAPSGAAQADISVVSADGAVTAVGQETTVAAGHSRAVAVPRPAGPRQPFAIVVTPSAGSGPLYAVRVVTAGSGGLSAPVASLLPVASARTSITLPPVRDSYTAVLP